MLVEEEEEAGAGNEAVEKEQKEVLGVVVAHAGLNPRALSCSESGKSAKPPLRE